jgi:hypothetical protein
MTSIEWLRNELWEQFKWAFSDNIFEVAKQIHKQEMSEMDGCLAKNGLKIKS